MLNQIEEDFLQTAEAEGLLNTVQSSQARDAIAAARGQDNPVTVWDMLVHWGFMRQEDATRIYWASANPAASIPPPPPAAAPTAPQEAASPPTSLPEAPPSPQTAPGQLPPTLYNQIPAPAAVAGTPPGPVDTTSHSRAPSRTASSERFRARGASSNFSQTPILIALLVLAALGGVVYYMTQLTPKENPVIEPVAKKPEKRQEGNFDSVVEELKAKAAAAERGEPYRKKPKPPTKPVKDAGASATQKTAQQPTAKRDTSEPKTGDTPPDTKSPIIQKIEVLEEKEEPPTLEKDGTQAYLMRTVDPIYIRLKSGAFQLGADNVFFLTGTPDSSAKPKKLQVKDGEVAGWTSALEFPCWMLQRSKDGHYEVTLEYSLKGGDSQIEFWADLEFIPAVLKSTGGWDKRRKVILGGINVPQGLQIFMIRARRFDKEAMRIHSITLKSVSKDMWVNLKPLKTESSGGSIPKIQKDLSVLSTGPAPKEDDYTVTAKTDLMNIKAIRLEAISHKGYYGLSRGEKAGSFQLAMFEVLVKTTGEREAAKPVDISFASTDKHGERNIASALDGKINSSWSGGNSVKGRQAYFVLDRPIAGGPGTLFTFRLRYPKRTIRVTIERFRLALTTSPRLVETIKTEGKEIKYRPTSVIKWSGESK